MVWSPHQFGLINRVESLQTQFLRMMAFKIYKVVIYLITIAKKLIVKKLVGRRRNIIIYQTYHLSIVQKYYAFLNIKFLIALCGPIHYLIPFL